MKCASDAQNGMSTTQHYCGGGAGGYDYRKYLYVTAVKMIQVAIVPVVLVAAVIVVDCE